MRGHLDKVYNLALGLTGNAADAWDLAQTAMLRALRGLSAFRGEAAVDTWLFRITVNAWKSRKQSASERWWARLLPLWDSRAGEDEPVAVDAPDPGPSPEGALERAEESAALARALAAMAPEERAALELREIEEKSYEEIAGIMEVPIGTVKSRLHRARLNPTRELGALAGEARPGGPKGTEARDGG